MHTFLKSSVIVGILSILFLSRVASAQWAIPFGGYWGWNGSYSTYSQDSIPYFALNPPVYYSYPVARTYGLYPFPYIPESASGSSTNNCFARNVEPKLIINKNVENFNKPVSMASDVRQPLRIHNPFTELREDVNSVKKASWEKSGAIEPKVVHPIDLTSIR